MRRVRVGVVEGGPELRWKLERATRSDVTRLAGRWSGLVYGAFGRSMQEPVAAQPAGLRKKNSADTVLIIWSDKETRQRHCAIVSCPRALDSYARPIGECGMATPKVVPAFHEAEDDKASFDLRAEAVPIEELALERREEALAQSVVVRVTDAAHRWSNARLRTALAEGDRRVLAALVGVTNHVRRPALPHGHVQRGEHQLRPEIVSIAQPITRR